jgi:hypothetical protein
MVTILQVAVQELQLCKGCDGSPCWLQHTTAGSVLVREQLHIQPLKVQGVQKSVPRQLLDVHIECALRHSLQVAYAADVQVT